MPRDKLIESTKEISGIKYFLYGHLTKFFFLPNFNSVHGIPSFKALDIEAVMQSMRSKA